MVSNWVYNLDMLAQNGILDYDAASYIMGVPPRYGYPYNIPQSPNQPKTDEFRKKNNKNIVNPSVSKKWALGLISAGILIFGGMKFKSKLASVKTVFSKFKLSSVKDFFVNSAKSIGKFFKDKFTGKP